MFSKVFVRVRLIKNGEKLAIKGQSGEKMGSRGRGGAFTISVGSYAV